MKFFHWFDIFFFFNLSDLEIVFLKALKQHFEFAFKLAFGQITSFTLSVYFLFGEIFVLWASNFKWPFQHHLQQDHVQMCVKRKTIYIVQYYWCNIKIFCTIARLSLSLSLYHIPSGCWWPCFSVFCCTHEYSALCHSGVDCSV